MNKTVNAFPERIPVRVYGDNDGRIIYLTPDDLSEPLDTGTNDACVWVDARAIPGDIKKVIGAESSRLLFGIVKHDMRSSLNVRPEGRHPKERVEVTVRWMDRASYETFNIDDLSEPSMSGNRLYCMATTYDGRKYRVLIPKKLTDPVVYSFLKGLLPVSNRVLITSAGFYEFANCFLDDVQELAS